jgi:hypothetical protein
MPDGKMCVHLMRALPAFGSDDALERMIGVLQDMPADAQRRGLAPPESAVDAHPRPCSPSPPVYRHKQAWELHPHENG